MTFKQFWSREHQKQRKISVTQLEMSQSDRSILIQLGIIRSIFVAKKAKTMLEIW